MHKAKKKIKSELRLNTLKRCLIFAALYTLYFCVQFVFLRFLLFRPMMMMTTMTIWERRATWQQEEGSVLLDDDGRLGKEKNFSIRERRRMEKSVFGSVWEGGHGEGEKKLSDFKTSFDVLILDSFFPKEHFTSHMCVYMCIDFWSDKWLFFCLLCASQPQRLVSGPARGMQRDDARNGRPTTRTFILNNSRTDRTFPTHVLSSRNVTTAAVNRSRVHLLHAHKNHRVSVGPILFLQPHTQCIFLKRLLSYFFAHFHHPRNICLPTPTDLPSFSQHSHTAAARRGIEICTFSRCNRDGWRAASRRVDAWQFCGDENTYWMGKVYLLQLLN